MQTIAIPAAGIELPAHKAGRTKRIDSIDLLRGIVMIIMTLDHVRDYFHDLAFMYSPEDLAHTNIFLFFTRWITHFCAPVFVFLAGTSACLYGVRTGKRKLSFFLFTRGAWLVIAELFILSLFRTFNLSYSFFSLQVIWAIGISMIVLSAIIHMPRPLILLTGILLIAAHNLLDPVHVPGNGMGSFAWSLLHEPGYFTFGHFTFRVLYPVIPWIGIIAAGYCLGSLYIPAYDPEKRKKILFSLGGGAVTIFIILRLANSYGDTAHWSVQENAIFSVLSFLNVTKYPPSLIYTLMTLGPALIFAAFTEKPLNSLTEKIAVFGRVPLFYYLAHIPLIHMLATIGAVMQGYKWTDMILTTSVNSASALKGYGFNLVIVYAVWIALLFILYPFCKWFDRYKRIHQATAWWLSYL